MSELNDIIKRYVINYSKSELIDILKLIYQNEFGPAHLVENNELTIDRIITEGVAAKTIARPGIMAMPIGNGLARVHCALFLQAFLADITLAGKMLGSMFAVTSELHKGTEARFKEKVDDLLEMVKEGEFDHSDISLKKWARSFKETKAEVDRYAEEGYPIPSHSHEYKQMYHPCYRVVYEDFLKYTELFLLLEQQLSFGRRVIVGIDGRAGAGKTTLAKILTSVYKGSFVSMDDFYLPFSMRSEERMSKPGGHIHFERFNEQVYKPLKAGAMELNYEKYNCQTGESIPVSASLNERLVVVEGSYSVHPWIRDLYSHTVFLDISEKSQKKRLIKRNGPEGYEIMRDKWILYENRYHKAYGVDKYCNILF